MKWHQVLSVVAAAIAVGQFVWVFVRWLLRRGKERPPSPTDTDYISGVTLSLLCALLWSLGYTSLSWIRDRADPLEINVGLLAVALATLLLFTWKSETLGRWILRDSAHADDRTGLVDRVRSWGRPATSLVVLGNIGSFLLFIYALYLVSAAQAITFQKTNPIFIAVLATAILGQRLTSGALLAVILVALGAGISASTFASTGLTLRSPADISGSLLALGAGFCFALLAVGLEKLRSREWGLRSRFEFLSAVFLVSFVAVLAAAWYTGSRPQLDPTAIAVLVANGVRVALVYVLFLAAIERIGAVLASVFVALEVPLTMLWDFLFLQRDPTPSLALGATIIILGGLTLVVLRAAYAAGRS